MGKEGVVVVVPLLVSKLAGNEASFIALNVMFAVIGLGLVDDAAGLIFHGVTQLIVRGLSKRDRVCREDERKRQVGLFVFHEMHGRWTGYKGGGMEWGISVSLSRERGQGSSPTMQNHTIPVGVVPAQGSSMVAAHKARQKK